ncbi:MAG: glutamine-hydrolyzing GMP synthase [Firmicutes bacterium]|nr:glutamine-hydrolyzing GMP synthase [Bacillota bacterium]
MPLDSILILDFGSQYTQLIARRVREARVFSEIVPPEIPADEIRRHAPAGIILSGGPASIYEEGAPKPDPRIFALGLPVLGICYGLQAMTALLGGKVAPAGRREYGRAEIEVREEGGLFAGLPSRLSVWMSHGDRVEELPPGFRVLASSANAPVAAAGDPERRLYGVQFHPEVAHTPDGPAILANFLYRVCGCRGDWTPANFIAETVAAIKAEVGEGRALCALSGGVDSTVAAVLVRRAIGDRLVSVFVDNGLLRKNEAEEVLAAFSRLGLAPVQVRAAASFLARLRGVTDPEEKRKRIGTEFIRVFEEEAKKLGPVEYLVQGTLYPDVIESAGRGGHAATIKTHHNVGGLPPGMRFRLIEPLRLLFKDEVRVVGQELGIPHEILWRQPFPGPGLAVRVLGEVTEEKLAILREADAIVREEIARAGLAGELWQYFAVLLENRSVGVMGDERTYGHVVAVRAVTSRDAMTADWARLPHEVLAEIGRRIVNEVPGVNRVVYDISSKPPATIEWE